MSSTTENFETLSEIVAIISILIKFGFDNIIEDKTLLVAFLNEAGVRYKNRLISKSTLFNLTQDITTKQHNQIIEEFNVGFKNVYQFLASRTNHLLT